MRRRRRHTVQESHDETPQQRNDWTILFALFPLALLLYVWNSVHEEQELADPRDAVIKSLWDVGNDTGVDESFDLSSDVDEIPKMGIWIYVESWHPGMTNWKPAFAEVLVLAEKLDAVLVEPGIQDTQLIANHEGTLLLSDIYNRTLITNFYPKLASSAQFDSAMNQLTVPQSFNVCLRPAEKCYTSKGEELESNYQERMIESIDDALEAVRTNPHIMVVLRLHGVWKSSLDPLTIPGPQDKRITAIERQKVTTLQTNHFRFLDSHYQFLDSQLQAAGVAAGSFAVVHWTPDKPDMDYVECAQKILKTKQAMNLPPTIPFFLLSSLSTLDPELMEETKNRANDASDAALALLAENGFLNLDSFLPPLKDSILYTVMNLMLGERAFSFATCSDLCLKKFEMCEDCNFVSGYGTSIMTLRGKENPNTFPCWPKMPSELQSINALWNG